MPTYTVQDTTTNKTVTFEWNAQEPPSESDMIEVFAAARRQTPEPPKEEIKPQISGYEQTKRNISRVYPVAETAAHLATSAYGLPLSGLAGLFALPFGLEAAGKTIETVQKGLVYQPQTTRGKELTEAAMYPMQKLEQLGEATGRPFEEAGHPNIAAGIHSAVVGAPAVLAGARAITKPSPVKIDAQIAKAIDKGIEKAVRPSAIKKETYSQVVKYKQKARTAVREIVKNKHNLEILDKDGVRVEGLPKTLDQFNQAIDQTKRVIFEEYDAMAQQTGKAGVKIDLKSISEELDPVVNNKVLKDLSPETIDYAIERMSVLEGRGVYTAVETQEAIQLLNQTLKAFYRDPTPQMKGKAFVDALIANKLRKNLDAAINKVTAKDYQGLKNKYGALREIEKDVTKRSIVDARKNVKGLLDFSDIYTGYHVVKGVLSKDPTTVAAGGAARTVKWYYKLRNDPNNIVKNMFQDVEKLTVQKGYPK